MYKSILRTMASFLLLIIFIGAVFGAKLKIDHATFKMLEAFVIVGLTIVCLAYVLTEFWRRSIMNHEPMCHERRVRYKLHPFSNSSEDNTPVYLIEIIDNTIRFYYEDTLNGRPYIEPMSIALDNTFIMTYTGREPVVIKVSKSYHYPMSKFEAWWFGELEHPDNGYYFEVHGVPVSSINRK